MHVLGAPPAFVLSQDQTLKKVFLELDQGPPLQYTLHLAQLPLFSFQRTTAFSTRAA
ncbi:protein of unknown function [Candidatus Nitrospira inopinata]|uniref:Uncharacterized protein n=1 Tax=Candidatus Nitrospira inopinata TaxID=1715989 RepID=A0A0S4KWP1_9BACT|nr:protein of unknown function [Candidatus Nitrospira inopinata]